MHLKLNLLTASNQTRKILKVVKSLFEWAERILYRESVYVQDITKSIEKGTKSMPTKYTMTDQNYQEISQDENITMNLTQ